MAKQQFYKHPTLGKLPLVPHPTLEGRLVAYHGGRAIYECDAPPPEPEKKRAPRPKVETVIHDLERAEHVFQDQLEASDESEL